MGRGDVGRGLGEDPGRYSSRGPARLTLLPEVDHALGGVNPTQFGERLLMEFHAPQLIATLGVVLGEMSSRVNEAVADEGLVRRLGGEPGEWTGAQGRPEID